MADAVTFVFHPASGQSIKSFNEQLLEACENTDVDVTDIQAQVVDGALVVTLLAGVVQATDEDIEDEKENLEDGEKVPFKVGDWIPDGDILRVKCSKLNASTPESANLIMEHLQLIYDTADGMIVKQMIVTGRGLRLVIHPDDVEKPIDQGQKRKVYMETDVHYAVVVFLAEALGDDDQDDEDAERELKRARPTAALASDR